MNPVPPAPPPDFEPLEKIRETSQAIWYRALQKRLRREVLLKARPLGGSLIPGAGGEAPPGPAEEARALQRAREEMVLLSRLQVYGVAAAIDTSASGGWLYQVVELPHGRPLPRAFQERGREPWPAEEALAIAGTLAEALAHAHQAGIQVRRLLPDDIFLASDGRVKLASLEWAAGPGRDPGLPLSTTWLAPELSGGGKATPAVDSYALGLLISWLLTGREPPSSGLRRADEKALEALRARGVRPEVLGLVGTLLASDPSRRPASGAEALAAVQAARAALERRRAPLRPALAVAAAAVVLLVAVGALVFRGGGEPVRPDSRGGDRQELGAARAPAGDPARNTEPAGAGKVEATLSPDPTGVKRAGLKGTGVKGTTEPEPPAETPPSAAGLIRRELAAIRSVWESDRTGWSEAEKEIEHFLDRHPGAECRPEAEALRAEVRSHRRRAAEAALEVFRTRDLPALLDEGSFAAASRLLRRISEAFPAEAGQPADEPRIAELRRVLEEKQEEAVGVLAREVEGLLQAGQMEAAERRVREGAARLAPPRDGEAREQLLGRVAAARQEREAASARLEGVLRRANQLLETLRLDEAAEVLRRAEAPPGLSGPLEDLRGEVELSRAALAAVEAGADRAIQSRAPLRMRLPGGPGEPQEVILDARNAQDLTAHRRGSTATLHLSLLDLDPAALEALAGHAAGVSTGTADRHRRGLLALFLATLRVEPAEEILANASGELSSYTPRVAEARRRRFRALLAEAARRAEELRARSAPAAEWTQLRDQSARLVRDAGQEGEESSLRKEAEGLFLAAAREVHRSRGPEGLFRGKVTRERRDGPVRILYDFRESSQLSDWQPLGTSSRVTSAGRALRLQGAMRFLSGRPLSGRLRAVVMLPEKGYGTPPGLGVVLGFRDDEALPPKKKGPKLGPEKQPGKEEGKEQLKEPSAEPTPPSGESPPAGALALVLGHVALSGALEVPAEPEPRYISTPAHALFLVSAPLENDRPLWAVTSAKLQGPLVILAELGPGHLAWTVNGKSVLGHAGESAMRARGPVLPGEGRAGSIVVYTEAEAVTIDAVEVGGVLEEAWVEARLEELAREELRTLAR